MYVSIDRMPSIRILVCFLSVYMGVITIVFYFNAKGQWDVWKRFTISGQSGRQPWSKYSLPLGQYAVPSHYHASRGLLNGKAPCLESPELCLLHLEHITGVQPKLLSFKQARHQQKTHKTTGQAFLVPNIVHCIIIDGRRYGYKFDQRSPKKFKLEFFQLAAFIAIDKFLTPDLIIIWGDVYNETSEPLWKNITDRVANIYRIPLTLTSKLFGAFPVWPLEHSSDALRISVLRDFGGIYLDTDVLVLRSFDDVRVFNASVSLTLPKMINSAVIVAAPESAFLDLWMRAYETRYVYWHHIWNASIKTYMLSVRFPDLVHVVNGSFEHPPGNSDALYLGPYDWRHQFATHLYKFRNRRLPQNEEELGRLACPLGEVLRWILYGDERLTVLTDTWRAEQLDVTVV